MNPIFDVRAQRDAQYRARKAANEQALGISRHATPEQVHAAITGERKPWRFEATCRCGGRITGDSVTWRHDKAPADKHQGQAVGTLRQI